MIQIILVNTYSIKWKGIDRGNNNVRMGIDYSFYFYVWIFHNKCFLRPLSTCDTEICLTLILKDQRETFSYKCENSSEFQKPENFNYKFVPGAQD